MSVVVEHERELYSLIIDRVGDVITLEDQDYEGNPATPDQVWRDICDGIYRLDQKLPVVLDVPMLLNGMEWIAIRHAFLPECSSHFLQTVEL